MISKQEKRIKKRIALVKEYNTLADKKRKLSRVPIEPFQDGWELSLTISNQVPLKDKEILENFCKKHSSIYVCRDAKVIRSIRMNNKSFSKCKSLFFKTVSGNYTYYGPYFKVLSIEEYEKLSEKDRKYFYLLKRGSHDPISGYVTKSSCYVLYIDNKFLKLVIRKRIITEGLGISPDIESRMKKIDDELYILPSPPAYPTIQKMWKKSSKKKKRLEARKIINEQLNNNS